MTPDDLERTGDLPTDLPGAVPGQQAMFGVQITHISQGFQGLPPVQQLREYDEVVPGLAERIVRAFERPGEMAEAQMHQRHEVERLALTNDFAMRHLGLVLGFIIIMGFGAAGTVLILNDKSVEGLSAFVGALGLLISSLLYGDHRRREELAQKLPDQT